MLFYHTQQSGAFNVPFGRVGGGAMLFYMLQHYQNINHVVINDINTNLTICYSIIRNNPEPSMFHSADMIAH